MTELAERMTRLYAALLMAPFVVFFVLAGVVLLIYVSGRERRR